MTLGIHSLEVLAPISTSALQEPLVVPMEAARIGLAPTLVLVRLDTSSQEALALRIRNPYPSVTVDINYRMAFVWILTNARLAPPAVCSGNVKINPVPIPAPAPVGTSLSVVPVWISMNVTLTDQIRVAPLAPALTRPGRTRVHVEAG